MNTGQETNNQLLQAALTYASLGLAVFQVRPGEKRPAHTGWQKESTTDADAIRAMWAQNPACNIGIDTEKSGIIVFDYDVKDGKQGLSVRKEWQKKHGIFPPTWTVRTPSGGLQEYYKIPAAVKGATEKYGKCVDFRSRGNLVIAPPSVFNDAEHGGKYSGAYKWEIPPALCLLADMTAETTAFYFFSDESDTAASKPGFTMAEEIPEGGRTSALVSLAGMLIAKGLDPESAEAAIRQENEKKCNPPLTDDELTREVFPALHRPQWQASTAPYTRDLPINAGLLDRVKELDPANNKRYGLNDAGSARLFMDACGDTVQFVADRKKWFSYDGRRWDIDGENRAKERLKALADALALYTLQEVKDEGKRAELLKFYGKWQQLRTRETILKDAQSIRPAKSGDFDRNPFLLNCQNGVLDIESMTFRPHTAADMLSKMAAVDFTPDARAPRWESFVDEVTGGDKELAAYIQKALGYSLTGDTRHECFFILYGATSRNGKSTLCETFSRLMGDYAASARPETFTKKKYSNGGGPSEDIARLAGVRFVNTAEPPQSMELDAALVKSLTGRDTVTARRLQEGFFEYIPAFKLFFNSNHRPRVNDITLFASDRLKLIPFNVHFGEGRRDPNLKAKLTTPESLAGVLNWCIDGLQMLRAEGFTIPAAVRNATDEYRQKEDKLGQFLTERTESGVDFETPLMVLQDAFTTWCNMSGLQPVGLPKLKEWLDERQIYTKRKRPNGSGRAGRMQQYVLGLRLLPDDATENAEK